MVDAIEQRPPRGRAPPRSASAASSVGEPSVAAAEAGQGRPSGLLTAPLLPRAPSGAALLDDAAARARACAQLLWAELERVDAFCTEAVHELVEAIGLIYEEANHGLPVPTLVLAHHLHPLLRAPSTLLHMPQHAASLHDRHEGTQLALLHPSTPAIPWQQGGGLAVPLSCAGGIACCQ